VNLVVPCADDYHGLAGNLDGHYVTGIGNLAGVTDRYPTASPDAFRFNVEE
jgi:hypothetical protein